MRNLIATLLFALPALLLGQTYQIDRLEQLEAHVQSGTLVLLDLDNTVLHSATYFGHADWFYHHVGRGVEQGCHQHDVIRRFYPQWVEAQRNNCVIPCDETVADTVHRLQERGVMVMGLTHRQVECAYSTSDQVISLGIDLTKTAPHGEWEWFDHADPSVYFEGILFVGDYNDKGEVLRKFLDRIGMEPRHIVFADDSVRNLVAVERVLDSRTAYTGLHYQYSRHGWDDMKEAIWHLQRKLCLTVMSDEQARRLIDVEDS